MGAYFQNQVVTKDRKTGEEFTLVQEGGLLKFLETQYALNITMRNMVRELSNKTSKDNPAKVYTVCDYDESEDGEFVKEWLSGTVDFEPTGRDCKAVKVFRYESDNSKDEFEVLENSRFLAPSFGDNDPTLVEGLFSGFVVCKDTKQFLNINKVKDVANKLFDDHQKLLVSPLGLLTRKTTVSMGGGDIPTPHTNNTAIKDYLEGYTATWYNKDIYWSSERPDDSFTDITDKTACIEADVKGNISIADRNFEINEYCLLPVIEYNKELYENA